jgi:hypothetical protein
MRRSFFFGDTASDPLSPRLLDPLAPLSGVGALLGLVGLVGGGGML